MKNSPGNIKIEKRFSYLIFSVCFFILILLLGGCGRKAFPSAPSSMVPDPPKKLDAVFENGEIKVSWQLANYENVKAIHIYKSKIPKARFCPTCPYTFEPVGALSSTEKIYREKAVSGYHYAFKLEIESADGEMSSPRIITLETP